METIECRLNWVEELTGHNSHIFILVTKNSWLRGIDLHNLNLLDKICLGSTPDSTLSCLLCKAQMQESVHFAVHFSLLDYDSYLPIEQHTLCNQPIIKFENKIQL